MEALMSVSLKLVEELGVVVICEDLSKELNELSLD